MTLEELKGYRGRRLEIEDTLRELENHYVADTVKVCTPPSYTAHSKRIEGYANDSNTFSLQTKLNVLTARQRACERYIDSIEDCQTKQMFKLKFFEGKTYLQIAIAMGGKMTQDCVEKRIKRYIKKH